MEILMAIDFSNQSKRAVKFSLDMAQVQNGKLTLLFAFLPIYGFSVQMVEYEKLIYKKAKRWLKKFQKRGLNRGIITKFIINKGSLKKNILKEISQHRFDLVVMTVPIQKKPWDLIMPDEKAELIDTISLPILILPPNCHFLNLKRIAVVIRKSRQSLKTWEILIELTEGFRLPYQLLYFPKKENSYASISSSVLDKLKQHFPMQKFVWNEEKISSSKQENIIIKTKKDHTLLAYFAKPQSSILSFFTFSLVSKMASQTQIPLLIIKN